MTRHHHRRARTLPRRGMLIAALLALLAPAVAPAGTFEAYGPREFFRDPDLGVTESEFFTEDFTVVDPSLDFTLRVERIRASLVEVSINGTQVVERRDFIDAGGDVVEKSVTLWDINRLDLEMQADNDGLVTITIFGPDDDPPTISAVVNPEPNANGWNDTPVTVSFDCSDVTSGIAICPAAIYQDTEVDGRVISGQAVDLAGNTAEASVTVSVDLSLPTISIDPLPDPVSTPTVDVSGTVTDAFSGLESVTCNGQPATVVLTTFDCTVDLYLGGNTIVVEATDLAGNVATASVTINFMPPDVVKQLVDDQAPLIVIDHPADGSKIAVTAVTAEATVTGRVIDLLQGFTQSQDVEVTIEVTGPLGGGGGNVAVDTATAEVANGTFSAAGVRLRRGPNTITATAEDAAGNSASDSVTILVQELSGQRIDEVSGDNQSAEVATELTDPLVVELVDLSGSSVSGRNVVFEVTRGAGSVDGGSGAARRVSVATDGDGLASAAFTLGERSGAGNHQVTATATGFAGSVVFTASAEPGDAVAIRESSPTDRTGQPLTALPEPLVVYAHDAFGNPVPDTDVDFTVTFGSGQFTDTSLATTRTTGDDGRVAVFYILGSGTDRNSNAVTANLSGVVDPLDGTKPLPVTFKLSPRTDNSGAITSVFGIVLDQNYEPLSGVNVKLIDSHIEDTDADCELAAATEEAATTSAEGVFTFSTTFTDRRITLFADGSGLATPAGELCLEVVAYTGRATNLGPIFLPSLQTAGDTAGGLVLALDDLPGSSLTVAAGSATCPDAGACEISFTRLANDQLPTLPPRGRMPAVAWSVEPLGVVFDPPAEITVPNTGDFSPGETVDLFEFDHDLAQFIRSGTGTVSDDGASITSDPGFGIRRSGVGYVASSLLEGTWAYSCDDGNTCTCDNPDAGFFVDQPVTCPPLGLTLDTGTPDFNAGLCFHQPLLGPCEDGLYCTSEDGVQPDSQGVFKPDACEGGGCSNGTNVEDVDPFGGGSARLEIDLKELAEIIAKLKKTKEVADKAADSGVPCELTGPELIPNLTVKIRERCCESEQDIVNAYLYTPQIFTSVGFKCTLIGKEIKGLIKIEGNIGVSVNGKLQADFEDSLCVDDDCFYILSGLLEVEPFGELVIDILGGAAGASAKLAYPASLSVSQECTCEPELQDFIRDATPFPPDLTDLATLGAFPFAIDPLGNCGSATWKLCAGPLRFEGRIKLLGFIKIGFDFEFPGTTFCTNL